MSTAFYVFIGIFILSFALRIPVAFGMISASIAYFIIEGMDLGVVTEVMVFGFKDKFVLLAVPLFIFTARVMNSGGITERIFGFADRCVGHLRGGLAHVNVVASLIFSGMTGSALADASGLGLMEVKAMDRAGYDRPFSCAVTAASATIGPIIPPSIPIIIYAMLSGASVGALFLGGMVPGLLMAGAMMFVVAKVSEARNYPKGQWPGLLGIWGAFRHAFFPLLTPVILLGGIYSGLFTPTEAAAVAAVYAIVLLAAVYRTFGLRDAMDALTDTVESTGFLGLIIAGAFVFSHVIALEGVPEMIAGLLPGNGMKPWVLMLAINIIFLVLGCFVDTMVLLLVAVPMVLPVTTAAGIDPVHLGVVLVLNMMIGLLTPPFGMLLYTVCGVTRTPLGPVVREVLPFVGILIIVLFVCAYVPQTVLWLPSALGYIGQP